MSNQTTVVSYSDAYELITKKIIINKMSSELLKTQIEFSNASKILQDAAILVATEKIRLVSDLNDIFEKQLGDFDADRQDQCISIYYSLSLLDSPTEDRSKLLNKLATLDNKMRELSSRIDQFESTMPVEQLVTNFKISKKDTNNQPIDAMLKDLPDL